MVTSVSAVHKGFPTYRAQSSHPELAGFLPSLSSVSEILGWTTPPKWANSLWCGEDWLRAVEGSLKWLMREGSTGSCSLEIHTYFLP